MTEGNIKFGKFQKSAAIILALVFVFASFPFEIRAAAGQEISYVIKFKDENGSNFLPMVGSKIQKRFLYSTNLKFQNIYTFESTYNLSELKMRLSNLFVFLEAQKFLQSSEVTVNDPGFTLDERNIDKQWGLAKAGFPTAWTKTIGSTENIVAIIDTGVDASHTDLQSVNFVEGFNFITNQTIPAGLGNNSDDNGHGTLVAGILGATVNNGNGVAGTNWQISLMPIKSLDSSGKGDVTAVAEGMVWAADHGAQLINISLGGIGFGHDTTLAEAVSYAFYKNVLIFAAAGNDSAVTGGNLDQSPVFPICDDNNLNMIVGVVATDQNDLKPAFANYGKNCVDVAAPGKRILSTINYDPLTQKSSPNSYAYASGTSLAVPFVVGQAALIRSLYPQATNTQIRDRIISTADPIDNLNLIQCGGSSCRGFLGSGRINVLKSLEKEIPLEFAEWEVVKADDLSGSIYQIVGGQKRLISPFVYNQRFTNANIRLATQEQLAKFPEGSYVTPQDGTLVKYNHSLTVFIIDKGLKLPITETIFKQRGLSFGEIKTLSVAELDSWPVGNFYPPVEGTLVKAQKSPTVFWVIGQVLHPINAGFYRDKGLNIFPILTVSDAEISGYSKGEAFIR